MLLLWLEACDGDASKGGPPRESSDTSRDTGGDTDADSGTPPVDVAPVITAGDAWCYLHDVGDSYYQWVVSCSATDPQGTTTLSRSGTVTVTAGTTLVETVTLACNPKVGTCTSSFREDSSGVSCESAGDYTFRFLVSDTDGNQSEEYEVVGRRE